MHRDQRLCKTQRMMVSQTQSVTKTKSQRMLEIWCYRPQHQFIAGTPFNHITIFSVSSVTQEDTILLWARSPPYAGSGPPVTIQVHGSSSASLWTGED